MNKRIKKYLVRFLICFPGMLSIGITLFLFLYVFWKGKGVISLEFLTKAPAGMPFGTDGGIFPAFIGTLYLGGLSALAGGTLGIFCAVYLAFDTKRGGVHKIVQLVVSGLSGIPSIIFGLVSYTILIYGLGMQRCLFSAAITVSAMIIPFVAIRARKILEETGGELLAASQSLGISKAYTIRKMILPACMVELISTVALGMAYGMGAVAPILYTGVVMQAGVPKKLTDPFMSLPYHLYMLVNNGYSMEYAYGTAFVLMVLLLAIQIVCKSIAHFREGAQWKWKRRERK